MLGRKVGRPSEELGATSALGGDERVVGGDDRWARLMLGSSTWKI